MKKKIIKDHNDLLTKSDKDVAVLLDKKPITSYSSFFKDFLTHRLYSMYNNYKHDHSLNPYLFPPLYSNLPQKQKGISNPNPPLVKGMIKENEGINTDYVPSTKE